MGRQMFADKETNTLAYFTTLPMTRKKMLFNIYTFETFSWQFTNGSNKLECFSLTRLNSLTLFLSVYPRLTQVKYLYGVRLLYRLLAIPANMRLGCKCLPGTNTSLRAHS
jgi:hypothetical protein